MIIPFFEGLELTLSGHQFHEKQLTKFSQNLGITILEEFVYGVFLFLYACITKTYNAENKRPKINERAMTNHSLGLIF